MSVTLTVSGTGYAYPTTGDPWWRPSVTEWATAVTNAIAAGGGFSVSDTATIDLTLAAGTLSAAIVSGSITNTYVNAAAAIAVSKLAALTASRAVVTDGSGFISASAATATEVGYLSGLTGNIQAQLNAVEAPDLFLLMGG